MTENITRQADWRRKHPSKYQAHLAVERGLRRGEIQKQPCEVCGSTENIDAHHGDYSKPLDVRWLCRRHHIQHHKAGQRKSAPASETQGQSS